MTRREAATMTTRTVTVVRDGFQYLGGARWYADQLWFSDIPQGKVYRMGVDGAVTVAATVDSKPSGLGFTPDGVPLVVTQADNALRRVTPDGGTEIVADLAAVARGQGPHLPERGGPVPGRQNALCR